MIVATLRRGSTVTPFDSGHTLCACCQKPALITNPRLFTTFAEPGGDLYPAFAAVVCDRCADEMRDYLEKKDRPGLEQAALTALFTMSGPLSQSHWGFIADEVFDPREVLISSALPFCVVELASAAEVEAACGVDAEEGGQA